MKDPFIIFFFSYGISRFIFDITKFIFDFIKIRSLKIQIKKAEQIQKKLLNEI